MARRAQVVIPLLLTGVGISGCASHPAAPDAAASLAGLRLEVPCADHFNGGTECHWARELMQPTGSPWKLKRELVRTFAGDSGVVYDVTLHVRGVVEPKNFTGGEVQFGHFQSGGAPVKNDYNLYNIEVSDPHAVYTVNRHEEKVGHYTFPIDYVVTIPIRGGATVTLGAYDSNDVAIANHQRHVVPGVPPAPQPFDGQFFQVDVDQVLPPRGPRKNHRIRPSTGSSSTATIHSSFFSLEAEL